VSTRFVHTLEQGKPTVQLDKVLAVLGQLGVDFVLEPGRGVVRQGEEGDGWPERRYSNCDSSKLLTFTRRACWPACCGDCQTALSSAICQRTWMPAAHRWLGPCH